MPAPPDEFPRIRRALPVDSRVLAEAPVAAWRQTYAGLVPDEVLRDLSFEHREDQWRGLSRALMRAVAADLRERAHSTSGSAAS